jgi:dTDP-4-dehydrorhamnose 3,5-epimerase
MHWQAAPHPEVKLVRCTRGAIWDVIVDLRPDSLTYTRHLGVELPSESGRALYIPEGFAHGFVTLADNTDVFYQMSEFYQPDAARGVRWNDPAFGIVWPVADPSLHPRDAAYPDFVPERAG